MGDLVHDDKENVPASAWERNDSCTYELDSTGTLEINNTKNEGKDRKEGVSFKQITIGIVFFAKMLF